MANFLCPSCLDLNIGGFQNNSGIISCSKCNMSIPLEYANYPNIPRGVMSAVGFRGHGKSVYFASLFNELDEIARYWRNFYTFAVNEESLNIIKTNVDLLKNNKLPDPTPKNFPSPTIVRFSNMPKFGDRFFLFYDTSGEAFEKQSAITNYAGFVKRSKCVTFFLSLDDIKSRGEMHELLSHYVQGMTALGGNTKDQHLVVVLTKGDKIKDKLREHHEIWKYLLDGRTSKLGQIDIRSYMVMMHRMSHYLKMFISKSLKESQFLNFANDRFKSVEFCIVSSLGSDPVGQDLQEIVSPKRVIDPLLWISYQSLSDLRKWSL